MTAWLDAYRLRWKRRRLLGRAILARHALTPLQDRTAALPRDAVLCFAVMRNEALRLPWFLDHHRRLGVGHFLIVDHGSTDGSAEWLAGQADVSLWRAKGGYRAARFGMDWLTWLLARHGHGHWCLTLDADETLIYPHWESRDLRALTGWLDRQGIEALPAMMLDLYPKGRLSQQGYRPGDDPTGALGWFDAGNYTISRRAPLGNLWIQGGVRARAFFAADPRRAPTLTKLPLIRWNRRYAYVNSTHAVLPPRLNRVEARGEGPSGVLLHSKFLPDAVARAVEERARAEHFFDPSLFDDYYAALAADPDLWVPQSRPYSGWRNLEALGLMSRGGWT